MAFIGTFSRALLESATAVYFGGVPVSILDAQGNVILGEGLPDAPSITSTIADRTYVVGDAAVTVDLRTKFDGATSYAVSPTNAAVTIDGYTLTISPAAAMTSTNFTVRGINGGGASEPLTFKLTVNAPAPTLTDALDDQNLPLGGATVTIPLDDHFSGAASYAVSPAGQGATISTRNLVLSAAAARSLEITVTATNATGQAISDGFAFVVAQVQQAPAVTAAPSITGPTTVGGILTRTAGTATGIPAPSRTTVWLRNGDPITGQTGNTLDTTGFAVDDAITTRDVWTNSHGTATGTSDPVTLTVQPTLQATITPAPLVAGEDFEILFSAAPDSVSPPTLVRDADDARRYTGTAPDSGTLAIGAAKAGYTAFAQTYTYDPAPVVEPGSITVESDGTISITLPDSVTEPFDVQIAGETVTLDPAAYTPSGAPVVMGQPDIAGTGGDGEVLTVQSRALFAGHTDAGEIAIVGGWYRNDTAVGDTDGSYTQDDAVDGDKTMTWRETATNAAGSVTAVSNGILCPAAPAAGWWHPQALVHVDYANDRAWINGTTFASIAAAKTADAIKTAGGVDYIDLAGLGASFTIAATGTVPNDTTTRVMVAVDDGTSANSVHMGQTYSSSTHRALYGVTAENASVVTFPISPTLTMGEAIRLAFRAKNGGVYRRVHNGVGVNGSATAALPALNRLVLGNRSAGDRAWTGGLYQILLINDDLADGVVDGLLGA